MKITVDIPIREILDEAPFKNESLYSDINLRNRWFLLDLVLTMEFPHGCSKDEALHFFNSREDYIRERLDIVERTFDPGEKIGQAMSLGRMTPDFG
jgi:hypothetical protein